MTTVLRRAIVESKIAYRSLETQTGVNRISIQRFVTGATSLRLDRADILARFFGLTLRHEESTVR